MVSSQPDGDVPVEVTKIGDEDDWVLLASPAGLEGPGMIIR